MSKIQRTTRSALPVCALALPGLVAVAALVFGVAVAANIVFVPAASARPATQPGDPCVTPTPVPDANGDGIVNATDSLRILRFIGNFAGTAQCPIPLPFGNVNLIGGIDAVDSLCLLRFLGGFPPTTNCPSEPPAGPPASQPRP